MRSGLVALLATFCNLAVAQDCRSLEALFDKAEYKQLINSVATKADTLDGCSLNLIGLSITKISTNSTSEQKALEFFSESARKGWHSGAFNALKYTYEYTDRPLPDIYGGLLTLIQIGSLNEENRKVASFSYKLADQIARDCKELNPLCRSRMLSDSDFKQFNEAASDAMISAGVDIRARTRSYIQKGDDIARFLSIAVIAVGVAQAASAASASSTCTYASCKPYLSTGDLYNLGILK